MLKLRWESEREFIIHLQPFTFWRKSFSHQKSKDGLSYFSDSVIELLKVLSVKEPFSATSQQVLKKKKKKTEFFLILKHSLVLQYSQPEQEQKKKEKKKKPDNTLVYRLNLVPRSLTPVWVRSKNHREVRMGWHVARERGRESERKKNSKQWDFKRKKNKKKRPSVHTHTHTHTHTRCREKLQQLYVLVCLSDHLCAHWPEERWHRDGQFNMQETQQLIFFFFLKKRLCVGAICQR